jgi:hypothetical protein
MAEIHDVIAAFADGERVGADELKTALADRGGRDYLVDLLLLRDLVHAAGPAVLVPTSGRRRLPKWVGLAAAVSIGLAGGFLAGERASGAPAGAAPPPMVTAIEPPAPPRAAPAATRVIRLEPGVDWTEYVGG